MKLPVIQDEVMRQAFNLIENSDYQNLKRNQDITFNANRLIVTSPNGTMYQIVVSNAGVLSTVAV